MLLTGRSRMRSVPSSNETRQQSRSLIVFVLADDTHGTPVPLLTASSRPAPPLAACAWPPRPLRVHLALMNRISLDMTPHQLTTSSSVQTCSNNWTCEINQQSLPARCASQSQPPPSHLFAYSSEFGQVYAVSIAGLICTARRSYLL